jgi:hypothetical protein
MEMVAVIAFVLVIVTIVALYAPQWWIGAIILLTFTTFPALVPQQIRVAGYGIYLHEVPLFLGALYLLVYRPSNRGTDLCAVGIAAITAVGTVHGLWSGYDLVATMNDARGSTAMALCVFIVGRIASTPQAHIALQAVKITLWVSFPLVLLGSWGIVKLNARAEDASLTGAAFHDTAQVTRIFGQSTQLASAVLAIVIALWAIRPDLIRQTISYLIPALGITIVAFSRSALVVVALTLLLAPLFHWSFAGAVRAIVIAMVGAVGFVITGKFLSLTSGIPGMDYLRLVDTAYRNRVLEGFSSVAREYDFSYLYRQSEVDWLKRSIAGHEFFGNGFGFRYRPAVGNGFAATSGTYFAHHFYWWAIAKLGWCGLIAYMTAFVTPVVHALLGSGRFALRSAAGAAVVAHLFTNIVAPLPEDVFGAPVLGALLGIALLRAPLRTCRTSDAIASHYGLSAARR